MKSKKIPARQVLDNLRIIALVIDTKYLDAPLFRVASMAEGNAPTRATAAQKKLVDIAKLAGLKGATFLEIHDLLHAYAPEHVAQDITLRFLHEVIPKDREIITA